MAKARCRAVRDEDKAAQRRGCLTGPRQLLRDTLASRWRNRLSQPFRGTALDPAQLGGDRVPSIPRIAAAWRAGCLGRSQP